jgi:hypothetical protein
MVEFFNVEDGQFQVSPTWTLYWKWTGPITAALVFIVLLYAKWSKLPPGATKKILEQLLRKLPWRRRRDWSGIEVERQRANSSDLEKQLSSRDAFFYED